MARVTRVGRTELGWLCVDVDFGDHQNDFLFPDTNDLDVVRFTIREWRLRHPEFTGDHRTGTNIVREIVNHSLRGEL